MATLKSEQIPADLTLITAIAWHRECAREGQEVVVKDGYIPLPAGVAERELLKIQ